MNLFEVEKIEKTEKAKKKKEVDKHKCDKCGAMSEMLYGPTEWGSICNHCYVEILSKDHRKDKRSIIDEKL